jgi:probable addiction module antidote protein
MHRATGKTGSGAKRGSAAPSRPFRVTDHLKTDAERAAYLEALLEDGDSRVITIGLRDLAESAGGMAVIAERTGLSRETLYRTLSANGNPRLDTLSTLLHAMGLRLSVTPTSEIAAR